jgi:ribosomal protein S18 acetylase RimI-like enzyme
VLEFFYLKKFVTPMQRCTYRFARQSDLQTIRSELSRGAWNRLSELLEFSCTRPEWIILGFAAGALAGTLALATHTEFGLPLELFEFHGGPKGRIDSLGMFHVAIEKARSLGSRELFYTVPEDSAEIEIISDAGFRHWRNVMRFESKGPADPGVRGYRSAKASDLDRTEIIALIEQTSEFSADSQIEFYRRRFGGLADAKMTLEVMEFTEYDPRWWRVALTPRGRLIGIVLPVLAFGEPTIGFIGVKPECRGRKIASFLLAEAWKIMKDAGYSTLYAEADQRNVSMHRGLNASRFRLQCRKQEWRLEL